MKQILIAVGLFVCMAAISASGARARTWYVKADGTGDVPFFEAAMDVAMAGDTVLVAAGEYVIGSTTIVGGIVLRSEEGPRSTRLVGAPGTATGLACTQLLQPTEISGFWFEGFVSVGFTGQGAITASGCFGLTIRGCIFVDNEVSGIALHTNEMVVVENNTFTRNAYSVYSTGGAGTVRNNVFWDPVLGAVFFTPICNDVLHLQDIPLPFRGANFSADPQFCSANDFGITTTSPCAPGNAPIGIDCGLIGALSPDCIPTRVELRSWGAIKELFRN